jgi:hypothetical protein
MVYSPGLVEFAGLPEAVGHGDDIYRSAVVVKGNGGFEDFAVG